MNLNEFCVFLCQTSPVPLRVAAVQELLLGRGNAAVPGAGVIRPLDAGVVLGLAAVHLLVDHQVGPQTLLRRGDLTGQGGAAHNLHTDAQMKKLYFVLDLSLEPELPLMWCEVLLQITEDCNVLSHSTCDL